MSAGMPWVCSPRVWVALVALLELHMCIHSGQCEKRFHQGNGVPISLRSARIATHSAHTAAEMLDEEARADSALR